jgi:hypothetical protein
MDMLKLLLNKDIVTDLVDLVLGFIPAAMIIYFFFFFVI